MEKIFQWQRGDDQSSECFSTPTSFDFIEQNVAKEQINQNSILLIITG